MRHRVSGRKLKRSASHRRSLLRSLSTELIRHKRITTTEAKAKEASRYVESLISRARRAYIAEQNGGALDLHARRIIARDIQDRTVLGELFGNVAAKVAERPGGYTRVIRIGRRNGDAAEMAVLELVDYNLEQDESAVRSRSKKLMSRAERVRRSQEKQQQQEAAPVADEVVAEEVVEETVEAAEVQEEAADTAASEAQGSEDAPAEDAASSDNEENTEKN